MWYCYDIAYYYQRMEDNSLLNKKGDSHTTKPSDNDKLGNMFIVKQPLESIIQNPSSPSNLRDNIRRTLPQHLIDEANRIKKRSEQYQRNSSDKLSSIINNHTKEQKKQYVQGKLGTIKFTTEVNQDHGLPFPEPKQNQQVPFGLLCRGMTS